MTMTATGMTACVTVMNTDGAHIMFLQKKEVEQVVEWCKQWLEKGIGE